jgi:trans-aconitate methyltransferase
MRCARCFADFPDDLTTCSHCGFKLAAESEADRQAYFDAYRQVLQDAYKGAETPWGGAGKGGSYFDWLRLRLPIAEAVAVDPLVRAGSFLDIGCANGYLLECLLDWLPHAGITIQPHGLDYAPEILALAKARLPQYAANLFLGNAWDWTSPQRYDWVRSEMVYVPVNDRPEFVHRLLDEFIAPGGALLACQYLSSKQDHAGVWIDEQLQDWGFEVERTHSGYADNGREACRVAVVRCT